MTDLEHKLIDALTLLRGLVQDYGGVPRYRVVPGAALNAVIEEVVDPALEAAKLALESERVVLVDQAAARRGEQ